MPKTNAELITKSTNFQKMTKEDRRAYRREKFTDSKMTQKVLNTFKMDKNDHKERLI